jgi:23S rRNA (guanine745-N1)-methyltransferase
LSGLSSARSSAADANWRVPDGDRAGGLGAAARLLSCPNCAGALNVAGGAVRCEHGHSFDVAREGYVNLRVPPRRTPKFAGDDREMLSARRRFLDRGFYAPLSDAINRLAETRRRAAGLPNPPAPFPRKEGGDGALTRRDGGVPARDPTRGLAVLDAGCGEGYYLSRLAVALTRDQSPPPICVGLDIAKPAVALAARRYRAHCFICASTAERLPIRTGAIDLLLNVFAPRNPSEFARVVAPGGTLLIAVPSPEHLSDLRQRLPLLGIEVNKQEHLVEQFGGTFEFGGAVRLDYEIELDPDSLLDLIGMTPSARHLSQRHRIQAGELAPLRTRAGFSLLSFRRG